MLKNRDVKIVIVVIIILIAWIVAITILSERESILIGEFDITDTENTEYFYSGQSLNGRIEETGATAIYIYETRYKYSIMNKLMQNSIVYKTKLFVPNNRNKNLN